MPFSSHLSPFSPPSCVASPYLAFFPPILPIISISHSQSKEKRKKRTTRAPANVSVRIRFSRWLLHHHVEVSGAACLASIRQSVHPSIRLLHRFLFMYWSTGQPAKPVQSICSFGFHSVRKNKKKVKSNQIKLHLKPSHPQRSNKVHTNHPFFFFLSRQESQFKRLRSQPN